MASDRCAIAIDMHRSLVLVLSFLLAACGSASPEPASPGPESPEPASAEAASPETDAPVEPAYTVTLTSDGGDAAADAPRIVARLGAAGHEVQTVGADDAGITLGFEDEAPVADLRAGLLVRGRLEIHAVAADQSPVAPREDDAFELEVEPLGPERTPTYVGDTRESLAPVLARAADAVTHVECHAQPDPSSDDEDAWVHRCFALVLEPEPIVTSDDLVGAAVTEDPTSHRPVVWGTLTDEAGERFADATERLVQRRLTVSLDGDVLMSPIVQERIPGGRFAISIGPSAPAEDARRLAAVLDGGPLSADWELASP